MSVKVARYSGHSEIDVGYERACPICKRRHAGFTYHTFEVHNSDLPREEFLSEGPKKVVADLTEGLRSGAIGALCPHCNNFDPVAAARFHPLGFREGLKTLCHAGPSGCLLRVAALVLWAFMLLAMCMLYYEGGAILGLTSGESSPVPAVMAGVLMALPIIALGAEKLRGGDVTARTLARLPDEEVERLVKFLCRESGNDIRLRALRPDSVVSAIGRAWAFCFHRQIWPRGRMELIGSPSRRLRKAMQFAKKEGYEFPQAPPTKRHRTDGPGRWNWLQGFGVVLKSKTPADQKAQQALQALLSNLDYAYEQKSFPPGTVITVRMNPQTRAWGILIVNPGGSERTPYVRPTDSSFRNLEELHPFDVEEIAEDDIVPWLKAHPQVVVPAKEYANEDQMIIL